MNEYWRVKIVYAAGAALQATRSSFGLAMHLVLAEHQKQPIIEATVTFVAAAETREVAVAQ
jgi:hypothetical protein